MTHNRQTVYARFSTRVQLLY